MTINGHHATNGGGSSRSSPYPRMTESVNHPLLPGIVGLLPNHGASFNELTLSLSALLRCAAHRRTNA